MINLKPTRQFKPRTFIQFRGKVYRTAYTLGRGVAHDSAIKIYSATNARGNRVYSAAMAWRDIDRITDRIYRRIHPTCKWVFERLNPK